MIQMTTKILAKVETNKYEKLLPQNGFELGYKLYATTWVPNKLFGKFTSKFSKSSKSE